jgi:hypothetical protein
MTETVPQLRTVDLGREDHLVTWQEWFARAAEVMTKAVEPEHQDHLLFRVRLKSGAEYMVQNVMTHVAKGACYPDSARWSSQAIEDDESGSKAVCNVITGYMMMGQGRDNRPMTVSVTPCQIASVECVLVEPRKEPEPFGFAAALHTKGRPRLEEVEETNQLPPAFTIRITGPGLNPAGVRREMIDVHQQTQE